MNCRGSKIQFWQDEKPRVLRVLEKILTEEFGGRGRIIEFEQELGTIGRPRIPGYTIKLNYCYDSEEINVYPNSEETFTVTKRDETGNHETLFFNVARRDLYKKLVDLVEKHI